LIQEKTPKFGVDVVFAAMLFIFMKCTRVLVQKSHSKMLPYKSHFIVLW